MCGKESGTANLTCSVRDTMEGMARVANVVSGPTHTIFRLHLLLIGVDFKDARGKIVSVWSTFSEGEFHVRVLDYLSQHLGKQMNSDHRLRF